MCLGPTPRPYHLKRGIGRNARASCLPSSPKEERAVQVLQGCPRIGDEHRSSSVLFGSSCPHPQTDRTPSSKCASVPPQSLFGICCLPSWRERLPLNALRVVRARPGASPSKDLDGFPVASPRTHQALSHSCAPTRMRPRKKRNRTARFDGASHTADKDLSAALPRARFGMSLSSRAG